MNVFNRAIVRIFSFGERLIVPFNGTNQEQYCILFIDLNIVHRPSD